MNQIRNQMILDRRKNSERPFIFLFHILRKRFRPTEKIRKPPEHHVTEHVDQIIKSSETNSPENVLKKERYESNRNERKINFFSLEKNSPDKSFSGLIDTKCVTKK